MNIYQRTLLVTSAVMSALIATAADARPNQNPTTASHYAREDAGDRYPLGARDFYYQFAESRTSTPGNNANELVTLAAMPIVSTEVPQGQGLINSPSDTGATRDLGSKARMEEAQSAPAAPQPSSFALPIAALGLMLFVARRRSAL